MFASLRRYEVQARYAIAAALASTIPGLFALWLAASRFDATLGRIIYGKQGRFIPAFVGCVLCTLLAGAIGFVLGWNSAGQRRNHRSRLSWAAFFLGGTMLSLGIVLLIAFKMLSLSH